MKRMLGIGLFLCVAALVVGRWWFSMERAPAEQELATNRGRNSPENALLNSTGLGGGRSVAAAEEALPSTPAGTDSEVREDAEAAAPARVHGTITRYPASTATGSAPLAGCEILAFDRDAVVARALTDGAGSYALELPAGEWFVGSAPPGEMAWCKHLTLRAGDSYQLDHVHLLGGDLCVRVHTLESGTPMPVAGARVQLVETDPDRGAAVDLDQHLGGGSALSDLDGVARVPTSFRDRCVIQVRAAGFLPATVEVDFSPWLSSTPLSSDGCLHVLLEPEGRWISGRVLANSGEPLADAFVFADPIALESDPSRVVDTGAGQWSVRHPAFRPGLARTDERGAFQLRLPREDLSSSATHFLEWVVLPGRPELPHHYARRLDPREGTLEIRLPESRIFTVQFRNAQGLGLNGVASLRDVGGRAHFPHGGGGVHEYRHRGVYRIFPVPDGEFQFAHWGGAVLVGLSPGGTWRAGEEELSLSLAENAPSIHTVRIELP